MNKIILLGRLTKDSEVKYLQDENNTAMARYTIAAGTKISKGWKGRNRLYFLCYFWQEYGVRREIFEKGLKIAVRGVFKRAVIPSRRE